MAKGKGKDTHLRVFSCSRADNLILAKEDRSRRSLLIFGVVQAVRFDVHAPFAAPTYIEAQGLAQVP